jgi:hypothetical protein
VNVDSSRFCSPTRRVENGGKALAPRTAADVQPHLWVHAYGLVVHACGLAIRAREISIHVRGVPIRTGGIEVHNKFVLAGAGAVGE